MVAISEQFPKELVKAKRKCAMIVSLALYPRLNLLLF